MLDRIKRAAGRLRPANNRRAVILRRVITLLVSLAILAFYFRKIEWHDLGNALLQADLRIFLPARLFQVLLYLAIDVYLLQRIVIWFHRPIEYSKVLYGRASLYILSLINPQLANGGMFLYLMREAEISAEKLFGLIIFRLACSLWSINFGITLALSAILFWGPGFRSPLAIKLVIVAAAILWFSMIAVLGLTHYLKRFRPDYKYRPIWTAFFAARPRHYLEIGAFTLFSSTTAVISTYLCALSFGLKIPLHELIVFLPFVDIISTLPIAFAGLGTTTFAWDKMYGLAGTLEFLSFTVAFPVVTYLMRTGIALIALPRASREIQTTLSTKAASASEPND